MLVRTNIVVDFPGRSGYIYKESALADLVNMKSASGIKGIVIGEYLPDYNALIWLLAQKSGDFTLNGFCLVNGELVADISLLDGVNIDPNDYVAHPYVSSYDTIRTDKVITKIQTVVGIILVKNECKVSANNS